MAYVSLDPTGAPPRRPDFPAWLGNVFAQYLPVLWQEGMVGPMHGAGLGMSKLSEQAARGAERIRRLNEAMAADRGVTLPSWASGGPASRTETARRLWEAYHRDYPVTKGARYSWKRHDEVMRQRGK